jgi:photosystem II stability/assembly factor-like uncharacterized protein
MSLKTNVWVTQAGTVYLKKAGTFGRFEWGGRQMRLGESQDELGGASVTTRQNPRGGIERDSILLEAPGTVSFDLMMKDVQASRKKSELKRFFYHIDKRLHVEGRDRDAPDAWTEIIRKVWCKASGRTTPASTWEGEEEGMVTLPFVGLDEIDIYRVTLETSEAITQALSLVDVAVARGEDIDPEEGALLYAVSTLVAAGSPYLYVNKFGGDNDQWTAVELTEWTTAGATAVLGLGDFVLIVSGGEGAVLRSDDRGTSRVEVTYSEWAANAPAQVDGVDQTFIVVCGANGYIWASYDGGRTWETLSAGNVTTQNLNRIQIDRNNHQVIWACGAANALLKSENGGETWAAVTGPSAADALIGLWVEDEDHVLILNDDGELWETSDGGESWTQQSALDDMMATPSAADIMAAPGDVYYLVANDGTDTRVWRNVEGGADGYWVRLITANPAQLLRAIAVVDENRAVVVGGAAADDPITALIN